MRIIDTGLAGPHLRSLGGANGARRNLYQGLLRLLHAGMDAGKRAEMIQRAKGRTTVPQIFIGDRHVGGSDDLHALEHNGQLDSMLTA